MNEQFTTYTATDVAEGLQNFLICIEMFLAALAHTYAFPPRVRHLPYSYLASIRLLIVMCNCVYCEAYDNRCRVPELGFGVKGYKQGLKPNSECKPLTRCVSTMPLQYVALADQ